MCSIFSGKGIKCPDCGSTYVIEMKESPSSPKQSSTVKQAELSNESEAIHLEKSNSQSSIGKIPHLFNHTPRSGSNMHKNVELKPTLLLLNTIVNAKFKGLEFRLSANRM